MTDTGVLAALAILLLFVGIMVIVQRRSRREARGGGTGVVGAVPGEEDAGIDYRTLEQAEREVRDIEDDGAGGPPDHSLGDDWGPGTPRPPHRL